MVWDKHEYDKIPGTYVFDGKRSHSSYALNKLLFSFNTQESRDEYDKDPNAYALKFGVPDDQRQALIAEDFLGLIRMGANIYYLAKLALPKGVSVQDAGAAFQGISTEQFQAKLTQKGENLEDKLNKIGGFWNG